MRAKAPSASRGRAPLDPQNGRARARGASPALRSLFCDDLPVSFRAYDGSTADARDPVATVEIRSPQAIAHLLRAPVQLGLARAYVTGAIEVRGDMHALLHALVRCLRPEITLLGSVRLLGHFDRRVLRPAPVPAEEAPAAWRRGLRRHTRWRDTAAIAHHYDVSNRFYELLLGSSMAYSCAIFPTSDTTLDAAQTEKFDLICRKLDLRPGQRLLDVGAGWGGLVRHAARHYGVQAVGITLSAQQLRWAQRANAQAGLEDAVRMRLLDYRDLEPATFDAIASVGAMEHFGTSELAGYFAGMAARLRPGGRMLNHCITRPTNAGRHRAGRFIDRYVFPDGELQGPATVLGAMHDNGIELRHTESLREHYSLTLRMWGANLERRWQEAVGEIGERRARVWRLYMAYSRVGFDLNRIQVHQMLGVLPDARGGSSMPLRPDWDPRAESATARRPAVPGAGNGSRRMTRRDAPRRA